MPAEVEKYAEIFDKTIKITMHSRTSDDCVHIYNIDIFNPFDPESLLINIKSVVKNKSENLLKELKMFKVQLQFQSMKK